QNENLAASNADLAKDLRDEVYEMITVKNLGETEVKSFLVARYGDFVLYKPPVKKSTWLLWFGPFIMLAIGFFILLAVTRKNKKTDDVKLDKNKREAMRKLLDSEEGQ
ncbi:MAG: cytochrome c-type biogenesis protein, partial [Thiotrichaceae bacterium]